MFNKFLTKPRLIKPTLIEYILLMSVNEYMYE